MAFHKAERKNAKLRLAISGTSGSGKTFSALLMAKEFGTKIAVLDSERGSASLYAGTPGIPEFDVCELEETSIQEYLAQISEAAREGYEVLVVDSYSHSWMAALDAVDKSGGWARGGKTISPLVQKLVNAILSYPGHIIATMRSKTEYSVETNDHGKVTGMKKLGLAPVARPDTEYEFTVMLDLTREGGITVSKTRCSALAQQVYNRDTDIPKIAQTLKAWLSEGVSLSPADAMAERIRFAQSDADLMALIPDMKALSDADRAVLRPLYAARKAEFQVAE